MYYRLLILLVASLFIACSGESEKTNNKGLPKIDFFQNEFDFGTIRMGEIVTHDFLFKNNGDGDLYIHKVVSDCGCTVVNYKRGAIAPGEQSSIEAVFDSNGLPGFQMKQIVVHSNADSVVLIVSAAVDYELDKGFN